MWIGVINLSLEYELIQIVTTHPASQNERRLASADSPHPRSIRHQPPSSSRQAPGPHA